MAATVAPSVARFFSIEEPETITADQLQDVIIRRVEDIERVARTLKDDESFLPEVAERAAVRKENIANIPAVTKSHAPKL
jgi:hypothetical protein